MWGARLLLARFPLGHFLVGLSALVFTSLPFFCHFSLLLCSALWVSKCWHPAETPDTHTQHLRHPALVGGGGGTWPVRETDFKIVFSLFLPLAWLLSEIHLVVALSLDETLVVV
jgi:hypothetical protein